MRMFGATKVGRYIGATAEKGVFPGYGGSLDVCDIHYARLVLLV